MARTPEQIEELLDKVESLLNSYKEADDAFQDNQRKENWHNKYGERLAPYSEKCKLLNGDDFDLESESRKEYETQYSDLTDDEYIDALENNIKATLQRIWPEAPKEEIEQAAEEIVTEQQAEEQQSEEPQVEAEVTIEKEVEPDEVDEANPIDDFKKELEEAKANMPKRNKE